MKNIAYDLPRLGLLCAFLLSGCTLTAGCRQVETAPFGEGERIEIAHGTTAGFEELRIGLVNVSRTDYEEAGRKKSGLAASLSLFRPGNPPDEKLFDLRAGQKAEFGGYSVYAQEIRGGRKGSVVLRVIRNEGRR